MGEMDENSRIEANFRDSTPREPYAYKNYMTPSITPTPLNGQVKNLFQESIASRSSLEDTGTNLETTDKFNASARVFTQKINKSGYLG
jgi:hypothetical protein